MTDLEEIHFLEERIEIIESKIGKAEKLLYLIVGLQFPNVLSVLTSAGLV